MAYIQELQFKKEKREISERREEERSRKEGKAKRAEEKKERGKREERRRRDREEKGKREREAVTSSHRLHCEPLLPSTAFQCKHCHPICDRVNWFFDVSRKVLIEGGKKKKEKKKGKKKNMNLLFSTDSCLSILKKKILLIPKGFLLSPPKSPLPFQIPITSLLS